MRHPEQSKELARLLQADQQEKKAASRAYFHETEDVEPAQAILSSKADDRIRRVLQILDEIGEPSISNIGREAAQAISVLALHGSRDVLEKVLRAFIALYERDPDDTFYQAIPSMTDKLLLLEHKSQRFGTQWMFDRNKQPFLPSVEDFDHVNERRATYDLESLRWPKSLAIPESEQPWLKEPIEKLVMRQPTNEEWEEFEG